MATPAPAPGEIQVLMIDDDRKLCRLVTSYLQPLGFRITSCHDGAEGAARAVEPGSHWHLILLDVMLPGMDGMEVLREIRKTTKIPVVMLTARGDETDRIVGLEMGADDYVPKTFSSRELLARIRAVLRRGQTVAEQTAPPHEIIAGALRINPDARIAIFQDSPLALTPVEFDLLLSLARAKGRVKSRETLLNECRERDYDVFDRSIDVHISSLRKKLHDDAREPTYIRTVRSAGYLFCGPDSPKAT